MGLLSAVTTGRLGQLSALSLVAEAGLAYLRGNKRVAALLLGASAIALRWSWAGVLAQFGVRVYQWMQ